MFFGWAVKYLRDVVKWDYGVELVVAWGILLLFNETTSISKTNLIGIEEVSLPHPTNLGKYA